MAGAHVFNFNDPAIDSDFEAKFDRLRGARLVGRQRIASLLNMEKRHPKLYGSSPCLGNLAGAPNGHRFSSLLNKQVAEAGVCGRRYRKSHISVSEPVIVRHSNLLPVHRNGDLISDILHRDLHFFG